MEPHEQTVWSPLAYRARTSRRKAGIVGGGSGKDPRTREVAGEFSDADAARTWFQVGGAYKENAHYKKKLKQKRRSQSLWQSFPSTLDLRGYARD